MNARGKSFEYGDLYVMQAECGLIKIGRSADVGRRLRDVSMLVRERVQLVAAFPGRGAEEDATLQALQSYRIINEWFHGTNPTRVKLKRMLGIEAHQWPYTYKPTAAAEFEAHVRFMNEREYLRKLRCSVKNDIKAGYIGPLSNASIWRSLSPGVTLLSSGKVVKVSRLGPSGDFASPSEPPNYLGDVEVAHSIGPPGWAGLPPGARPSEIVIAALEALAKYENQLASDYRPEIREEIVRRLVRSFICRLCVPVTRADGSPGLIDVVCSPIEPRLPGVTFAIVLPEKRNNLIHMPYFISLASRYVGSTDEGGTKIDAAFVWLVDQPIELSHDEETMVIGMIALAMHFRVGLVEGIAKDFRFRWGRTTSLYSSGSGWSKRAEKLLSALS